jgi:ubiquinone biosynthesis protein COQ9
MFPQFTSSERTETPNSKTDGRVMAITGRMSLPLRSSPILRRTVIHGLRSYHSPNHPPSPSYSPVQHKILRTALALVPSTGFTAQTLSQGAKEAGYLEITHNLFPRGPWSLVEYHLVTQREALSSIPLDEGGVGKTIRNLCVERLRGNKEVIGRWQEARP